MSKSSTLRVCQSAPPTHLLSPERPTAGCQRINSCRVTFQIRLHRLPVHLAFPRHRPGAGIADCLVVWRQRHDRCLQRGLPDSQPVSPPVCRGCLQPGLCAGAGRQQGAAWRSRNQAAHRPGGHTADLDFAADLRDWRGGRAAAGLGDGQRPAARTARLRGGGVHDALDVSVHRLHVAGGAVVGRAQHLAAFCGAGGHTGAA